MQVFYTSPWIPAEWIKAHGLEPRGIGSLQETPAGALPLSAGVCAFAETALRCAERHPDSAMIFTTACDQMRRGFDSFAAAGRSRAFLFNIPATWQTPAAHEIYHSEMLRMGRFLESMGGHAPSSQNLMQEMLRHDRARKRLLEAAPACSARQFAEAVAQFHWDGSVNLPTPPATPPVDGVPLAVVGGPLCAPQWKLLDVIVAAGGRVALNATETGERSLLPAFAPNDSLPEPERRSPTRQDAQGPYQHAGSETVAPIAASSCASTSAVIADDPFNFLVCSYFDNIVDVFQRPNTRLYSWLKERLAPRRVRGIVLWHFTGCDLWRSEAQTLRETFGLPVLLLEADEALGCSPRDAGRIQAFVETLK